MLVPARDCFSVNLLLMIHSRSDTAYVEFLLSNTSLEETRLYILFTQSPCKVSRPKYSAFALMKREEDPCQRCGFQNVVKVEAEVAASRSYGRSRTEINDSNI